MALEGSIWKTLRDKVMAKAYGPPKPNCASTMTKDHFLVIFYGIK